MATNPATQAKKRKRLREVERMVLDERDTVEIFDSLGKLHKVTYNTIRKDVVEVRKAHRDAVDKATELEGTASHRARTIQLRLDAIESGDLKLVHTLNQELARMDGVDLKINERTININLKAAITHMEVVLQAVFTVIPDQAKQDLIIAALDEITE